MQSYKQTRTTASASDSLTVVRKEGETNERTRGIDLATLDTTVVFSPSFVFTIMTYIKGMKLCLTGDTGTFNECS
jgi:hypothetical protein